MCVYIYTSRLDNSYCIFLCLVAKEIKTLSSAHLNNEQHDENIVIVQIGCAVQMQ